MASLEDILASSSRHEASGYRALMQLALPHLLSVANHWLDTTAHADTVVHDTLLLAWCNASRQPQSGSSAWHWLHSILGSRLHTELMALAGELPPRSPSEGFGPAVKAQQVPAERRGEALCSLSETLPALAPGNSLLQRLEATFEAEQRALRLPRTPTGERVHSPLFDERLKLKMYRSGLAYRTKMKFQQVLGRPFEDYFFRRWLTQRSGSRWLEEQGLPRRSVEAALGERLNVQFDPRRLVRGFSYPDGFPDRIARRKASNQFLWTGDWDLPRAYLVDSPRTCFIQDIWRHRLDLEQSDTFRELSERCHLGKPFESHHKGVVLDSRERILEYLQLYRFYMEDMACFGFNKAAGKDHLGIVLDRHGRFIKINKGLHRLAMAQVLGVPCVTARVRHVHRSWWECQTQGASGGKALERVAMALADAEPAP